MSHLHYVEHASYLQIMLTYNLKYDEVVSVSNGGYLVLDLFLVFYVKTFYGCLKLICPFV